MKIIAVDDNLVSRKLLQFTVEALGHECLVADNGEQAWQLFLDTAPEVVITDWMMPGTDGLELCRRIRSDPERAYTYVILATSLDDRENVLKGMAAGADDYLTKPIHRFDLETRLVAAQRVTALHADLARYRAELVKLAGIDPLTQLHNRRSLGEDLSELHSQAERYGRSYCLAMCDLDSFKAYNDNLGHQAGDEVLRTVGTTLIAEARQGDTVYRYGGEEFLVVLPEQTLVRGAVAAERFRAAVESLAIPHPAGTGLGAVTISIGVAAFDPGDGTSSTEVLAHADMALYQAKRDGRNRVVLSGGDHDTADTADTADKPSPGAIAPDGAVTA